MEPLSNWDAMFVAAASSHATLPRAKGCIKVSVHPTAANFLFGTSMSARKMIYYIA